ncbi:antiviral helicase [Irpex rosettiformis]|uniref:Antiviral helicase n=1 Tax=Irpex rosettiformis TaxID=378272 RepID=A0ACB8ULK1_9APHY|nr:antiviral helicase [Irpex rosettiformis]
MASSQDDLLRKITNPDPGNAEQILDEFGLNGIPSPETVHRQIERKLLLPPSKFPDHWLPHLQKYWDEELSIPSLLPLEPSPPPTSLAFVRSGLNGRVTGYTEVVNPRISTGLTSTSVDRAPAPSSNFVRGKSGYVPFWPGGLDDIAKDVSALKELDESSKGLKSIPPGFARGLRLPGDPDEGEDEIPQGVNAETQEADTNGDADFDAADALIREQIGSSEIDDLLPLSRSNLKPVTNTKTSRRHAPVQKRDWAHEIDVNRPMKNFHTLVPDMAHKYPFELDTFQKEAVYHLEMGDSVFVAAHTSAGKTVVAEYAIALAAKHMTRAIYTSPIKALSNQKYRDFKQTFSSSSVGILTGDVQINPEASCLIMTTEILRSMLYKGADLIRDVEFVIFDEVHYVNDAERGVVWEEVIIMLPEHVNIILLSATVPNTKEFADWVGRTKKKDIYVISTPKRPVPLEHFLYAGKTLHKVVDANGNFQANGYKDAGEALRRKQDKEREAAGLPPVQRLGARAAAPQRGGRGGPPVRGAPRGGASGVGRGGSSARTFHQPDKNLYVHLVGNLRKLNLLPVVVFTFSKKRCEENAGTLTNADLCTASEKSEIHVTIEKALSRLKEVDRKLPQIRRMRDLLSRGIGVHHGGLLPIVKEVVELLFGRGLVKVLFATETFAMGVNMPTRCVVFSHIRKHDGRSFREILPGEYTQMAGRAGRRGLDATGTVIIVANDGLPEQTTLINMITGKPTRLQSQFRLTYNMILNLLRVEALRVEEMIKRSFSENASQRLLPQQQKKVVEIEKTLTSLRKLECDICMPAMEQYYDDVVHIVELNHKLLTVDDAYSRKGRKQLLNSRVVILSDSHFKCNIGLALRAPATTITGSSGQDTERDYIVLGVVDPDTKSGRHDVVDVEGTPLPPIWPIDPASLVVEDAVYDVITVPLSSIVQVTDCVLKVDIDRLLAIKKISAMNKVKDELLDVLSEWVAAGSIPEVDWNSRIKDIDFQEMLQTRDAIIKRLPMYKCKECPDFENHFAVLHGEKVLRAEIAQLRVAISDQNLELIPDYEQRVDVLKELKFIDVNSTVLLKGRVACEINSANELVLTELILENTLADYEPEEVVALLSCFIFQEKTEIEPVIPPKLEQGRDAIIAIAERVERVQEAHKVPGEESRALKFGLMEVVYEWAKGMPFEQITDLTDVAEGTIVRCITRLDETCREVRDAARVIGDAELFKKMEEAQMKIKRDIVFAASLYF